jgi:hypothetical protein
LKLVEVEQHTPSRRTVRAIPSGVRIQVGSESDQVVDVGVGLLDAEPLSVLDSKRVSVELSPGVLELLAVLAL